MEYVGEQRAPVTLGVGVLDGARIASVIQVWNQEHPAHQVEPEWAEELAAAHDDVASKTMHKDEGLALCEVVRELAARLPDGFPQMLTGNNNLRGRRR